LLSFDQENEFVTQDIKLSKVSFISRPILKGLRELEINTVRQLFTRLRSEEHALKEYMQLSTKDFDTLRQKLNTLVSKNFPEDLIPRIQPPVNKRGVAAHRLQDASRPRYYTRKASS
jgi:hypothetical protein